ERDSLGGASRADIGAGMHQHRLAKLEARLLPHLSHGGVDRRLVLADHACGERIRERIVPRGEEPGPELVHEHDLVADRVVPEHGDGMTALHDLARQPLDAALVTLHVELVPIHAQEAGVKGRHAPDLPAGLTKAHAGSSFRFDGHRVSAPRLFRSRRPHSASRESRSGTTPRPYSAAKTATRGAAQCVTAPRSISGVLNANETRPALSTAIKPPSPPRLARRSWMTLSAAVCTSRPAYAISAATARAAVARRSISPCPVQETAHDRLLANVPAPMTAESPTRPSALLVMPPVEVAAARLPCASRAAA